MVESDSSSVHCIYCESTQRIPQLHVRLADEKFLLGPAPSVQSYLNMERYVAAIKARSPFRAD